LPGFGALSSVVDFIAGELVESHLEFATSFAPNFKLLEPSFIVAVTLTFKHSAAWVGLTGFGSSLGFTLCFCVFN